MPAKRRPGRGRIDLKYPPAFCDRVARAASAHGVSIAHYMREAVIRELERDGQERADVMKDFVVPLLSAEPEKPARKRKRKD